MGVPRTFWGPLTALGLTAAAIACVLDQASKLWLLKVFDLAGKGAVKVAPFVDFVTPGTPASATAGSSRRGRSGKARCWR